MSSWQEWFEKVWEFREETVYPRLFGTISRGIFPLSADMFVETFKQSSLDPRWLHFGVFEFSPTPQRRSWLYVTSGMSNAWGDEEPRRDGPSGYGCEFVLETPYQENYAILRLQHVMAAQILLMHGRFERKQPLSRYDRIPLKTSFTPEPSQITWLLLTPPESFPARFELDSGWVDLDLAVGISEQEAAFARSDGGDKLVELLKHHQAYPVTDPRRKTILPDR